MTVHSEGVRAGLIVLSANVHALGTKAGTHLETVGTFVNGPCQSNIARNRQHAMKAQEHGQDCSFQIMLTHAAEQQPAAASWKAACDTKCDLIHLASLINFYEHK